jgi:hypothetical protein
MMIRVTFVGGTVRSKVLASLIVGGIAFVAVAGCTSGSTGSAVPSGSPTTSAAASTTPKSEITDPLNVDKLVGDICSGFTDAQLAPYLGALSGKDASTVANGPLCTFRPKDPLGPTVGGAVANIPASTQEALYESQRGFAWRQKISPIAGYPAVDASTAGNPADPAHGGDCSTDVAVNDKQYIGVDFSVTNTSDPNFTKACTVSEALAAVLVQNIKSGGA